MDGWPRRGHRMWPMGGAAPHAADRACLPASGDRRALTALQLPVFSHRKPSCCRPHWRRRRLHPHPFASLLLPPALSKTPASRSSAPPTPQGEHTASGRTPSHAPTPRSVLDRSAASVEPHPCTACSDLLASAAADPPPVSVNRVPIDGGVDTTFEPRNPPCPLPSCTHAPAATWCF